SDLVGTIEGVGYPRLTPLAAGISYWRYGFFHSDPALALTRAAARGGGTCRDLLNSLNGADRLCTSTWSALRSRSQLSLSESSISLARARSTPRPSSSRCASW